MEQAVEKAKTTIVYLAYGLETTKYQAIISIFTLYHHIGAENKDFAFVIYTDSDCRVLNKYLVGLPVTLEVLTKQQVKQFRGANNYVFRIKPCILQDYFKKNKGSVLYMDTDTFFTRNPVNMLKNISPGHAIMNVEEYNFLDGGSVEPLHWFNFRQCLKRYKYNVLGKEVSIPLESMMWNAGIIGLDYADSKLVDAVIKLTDDMYSKVQVFIVEQFAASYILQTNTAMRSTEDYIEHYWPKFTKNSFNVAIPGFLKQNENKSGQELYDLAFEFAEKIIKVETPYQEPLTTRISTRMKLVMQVMRKGYL